MRTGVGAEFPHHDRFSGVEAAPHATVSFSTSTHSRANPIYGDLSRSDQTRANIGRLFFDLRNALQVTPHHVASHLFAAPETVMAIESGQFEYLTPWPETVRVVMPHPALAGIDGRPVLTAIADVLSGEDHPYHGEMARGSPMPLTAEPAPIPAPAPKLVAAPSHGPEAVGSSAGKWKRAGTALAKGAKRLPADALKQVRQRPFRAFYAASLPLGILVLLLNTSALEAAFGHVPRPVARLAQDVRHFFQEQFAPIHDGLRWIEVDDPRRRRADKLHERR